MWSINGALTQARRCYRSAPIGASARTLPPIIRVRAAAELVYIVYMTARPTEPIREVRANLAEIVERAEQRDEPTIVTRRGKPVAAVVSMETLRRVQELQEQEATQPRAERTAAAGSAVEKELVRMLGREAAGLRAIARKLGRTESDVLREGIEYVFSMHRDPMGFCDLPVVHAGGIAENADEILAQGFGR